MRGREARQCSTRWRLFQLRNWTWAGHRWRWWRMTGRPDALWNERTNHDSSSRFNSIGVCIITENWISFAATVKSAFSNAFDGHHGRWLADWKNIRANCGCRLSNGNWHKLQPIIAAKHNLYYCLIDQVWRIVNRILQMDFDRRSSNLLFVLTARMQVDGPLTLADCLRWFLWISPKVLIGSNKQISEQLPYLTMFDDYLLM